LIFETANFTFNNFKPPPQVRWARRILIKPHADYSIPYPITTSRESLEMLIRSIRRVSEADIILLGGSRQKESMRSIYCDLGYDFPGVIALDVKDCIFVEVENPLVHPFALPTFWLPNILLYCDYLITMTPHKVFDKQGSFSIRNLLGLLPPSKYQAEGGNVLGALYNLGIEKVIADLYFTLPFDLGIIDAGKRFFGTTEPGEGRAEDYGKIFIGDPYEVDCEASQSVSLVMEYLQLIEMAKSQLASDDGD
jgi:hypothetical protein